MVQSPNNPPPIVQLPDELCAISVLQAVEGLTPEQAHRRLVRNFGFLGMQEVVEQMGSFSPAFVGCGLKLCGNNLVLVTNKDGKIRSSSAKPSLDCFEAQW
ncbi:TPA: hypothetical protein DIS56_04275 [Candidatus Saccharibacteria bacterium]|nr:MAG: hypothetical protein UX30_C0003G0046 [Candidatus Saccharibacteria bacterium GW2011_GWA2_46_10]OGL36047.1 MAG: hypothetical protein A3F05_01010 [Candidatus Saccharibacteria bacterium RIFCSPHIGHO2_12_FULL_47_17]HCM52308.1 hypothetical protein [Candidatus Saccharibacteria bacterium]